MNGRESLEARNNMMDYDHITPHAVWNYSNNSYNHEKTTHENDNTYQNDLLKYYLIGICGITVCCLGIVGNIMSVMILTRRVMKSSTYSYLTALALSDTFFLFFTMLTTLKDTKEPKLGQLNKLPEPFYAKTFWFVHASAITFQVTSIWLTLAFTVDRYIMICHPFKAERWCSIKRARRVIFGLVAAGIAYNFIRFFEYRTGYALIPDTDVHFSFDDSNFPFNFSDFNNTNMHVIDSLLQYKEKPVIQYTSLGEDPMFRKLVHSWLYLTFVAGIPFISLIVLNTFLIVAVHNSRKKGKMINAKEKRRNDTTVMLIGVIVIFLICEGPALISRMIYALDTENSLQSTMYNTFSEVSNLLVTLNSAINIVPYYFFGKKFRQQFWRVFCSCVLTKEEIRKITRSLSVSMDRRFSNAGANGHEMNHITALQNLQQKHDNVVHKNSIAVPLILNIEERTSIDTQNPFLIAHQNHCLEDVSPTEPTNEQKKILIVKVGVTCAKYVTLKNIRPWAAHSYKNTRGRGTGLQPTGQGTDNSTQSAPTPVKTDSRLTDACPSGDVSLLLTSGEAGDKADQSIPKTDSPIQRRGLRSESSYPKPVSTYEKVRLILMPWKKPEGLLNKPVFKMMIESLMLYVMTSPGVHFNNICEKYSPYMMPFCLRELLDVLEELECVQKTVYRKTKKASLFSKSVTETQSATAEQYEDDEVYYEASPDCVVRLGQFIDKL